MAPPKADGLEDRRRLRSELLAAVVLISCEEEG